MVNDGFVKLLAGHTIRRPKHPFLFRTFQSWTLWKIYWTKLYGLPMSIFTPEDLILFVYQETSPENTASIQQALASNWALQEKFQVIESSVEELNTELYSPREQTILNILNYARETMPEAAV